MESASAEGDAIDSVGHAEVVVCCCGGCFGGADTFYAGEAFHGALLEGEAEVVELEKIAVVNFGFAGVSGVDVRPELDKGGVVTWVVDEEGEGRETFS